MPGFDRGIYPEARFVKQQLRHLFIRGFPMLLAEQRPAMDRQRKALRRNPFLCIVADESNGLAVQLQTARRRQLTRLYEFYKQCQAGRVRDSGQLGFNSSRQLEITGCQQRQ